MFFELNKIFNSCSLYKFIDKKKINKNGVNILAILINYAHET